MILKKGFVLYELIITCFLLSFLIFYFTPSTSFFSPSLIDEQVELLQQLFLYLQLYSASTQTPCILTIDCRNNTYSYQTFKEKKRIIKLPPSLQFGTCPSVFGPPSRPERQIKEPSTFAEKETLLYEVIFFPTMAISPGALYICAPKKLQTHALTVAIDSGALIRKYRWNKNAWKRYD